MEKDKDNTKIRVAVVIPRYYPVFGGAENQCRLLNRYLLASGKVSIPFIVTKHIERKLKREEFVDEIFVKRLGFHGSNRWSEYYYYLAAFFFLLGNSNKFDVVHCHATSLVGFLMTVLGRIVKKPVVLKLSTNGELLRMTDITKVLDSFPRNVISQGHKILAAYTVKYANVIALNQEGMDELVLAGAKYGHLIPNGIDRELWRPTPDKDRMRLREKYGYLSDQYIFVYTGRFVKRKGIDVLIDGFRRFQQASPQGSNEVQLCLVGSDDVQQDAETRTLLYSLGSGALKNIRAFPATENVLEFLQMADSFVYPSRNEGLPNAVLEALSVGLPCVLSDIRPHRDLEEKSPAARMYLFPPKAPDSLASTLERCYRDAFSPAGAARGTSDSLVAAFDIRQVARRYHNLYEQIIDHG